MLRTRCLLALCSGVDDSTFSLTGEAFATIALPESETTAVRTLQKDDISLAYQFAHKRVQSPPTSFSPLFFLVVREPRTSNRTRSPPPRFPGVSFAFLRVLQGLYCPLLPGYSKYRLVSHPLRCANIACFFAEFKTGRL